MFLKCFYVCFFFHVLRSESGSVCDLSGGGRKERRASGPLLCHSPDQPGLCWDHTRLEPHQPSAWTTGHSYDQKGRGRLYFKITFQLLCVAVCIIHNKSSSLKFKNPTFIFQVTKHGLILNFLSSFSGHVDFLHMEPEQASSYEEGSQVKRHG